MIVCVCKAVSDKRIRAAAAAGEVLSLRELTRELGVGTCCGKCVPHAREVLMETLARQAHTTGLPTYASVAAAL